jgi:voltage-gated sodium channel
MDEVLPHMPGAWIYFITFILFGTFVALNFFVGVIVNNLQSVTIEETNDMVEIRNALARLEARLESNQSDGRSDELRVTAQGRKATSLRS